MSECVREMTVKEMIEESSIENKDLIISRLKDADLRNHRQFERYETTISDQRYLIEAYRTVLKDMVYSNGIGNNFKL